MTRLELSDAHRAAIGACVCQAYPEEGCGVLLGRETDDSRQIERVLPLANVRQEARHHRFEIAPEHLLMAEREGRASGLEVVGFFHSHPDHPAVPSAFDLEHAWPYYSYVIVSVMHGRVADLKSWRLAADRSRFEPETIEPDARPTLDRPREVAS